MPTSMNYSTLKREMLAAMRGRLSQGGISKKMGFRFNQVSRWEGSRVRISWLDFLDFSAACRKPVLEALKNTLIYHGDPRDVGQFVQHLVASEKAADLSKQTDRSPRVARSWLAGRTSPSLEDVLEFIDVFHHELLSFVSAIVDLQLIPCLKDRHLRAEQQSRIIHENPELSILIPALSLEKYIELSTHRDETLAQLTGLGAEKVRSSLSLLEEAQIIKKVNGKYQCYENPVTTRCDLPGLLSWKKHYLDRYFERLQNNPNSQSAFITPLDGSHFFFCVSEDGERKLHNAYRAFLSRLMTIVETDEEKKKNIHLISIELMKMK